MTSYTEFNPNWAQNVQSAGIKSFMHLLKKLRLLRRLHETYNHSVTIGGYFAYKIQYNRTESLDNKNRIYLCPYVKRGVLCAEFRPKNTETHAGWRTF
jgi:hypothetical protein